MVSMKSNQVTSAVSNSLSDPGKTQTWPQNYRPPPTSDGSVL